MQNHILKFKVFKLRSSITLILFGFLMLFAVENVSAAELYFNTAKNDFVAGEEFTVNVMLDSSSEAVNAIEGNITMPIELLAAEQIFIGNSVINFWVDSPIIKDNRIKFSGIVPGGYIGDKGLLFSIVFKAKNYGVGEIDFNNYRILLNDGLGNEATSSKRAFGFTIGKADPKHPPLELFPFPDGIPPEEFTPELVRYENVFENRWFLVFSTQDKGSGVDYYEVCEGNQSNCEKTESPYILKNQYLNKPIYVKVVDKRGNGRIVVLSPPGETRWYLKSYFFGIIMMVLIFAALYVKRKY